jgi:hypothetical protein
MRLKGKQSVTMIFFSIFHVSVEALGRRQKKCHNSKTGGNLQARKFLKYLKKPEHSSYQESREPLVCTFSFFFCLNMEKSKLLIPSSTRYARYAWGKSMIIAFKERSNLGLHFSG